MPSLAIESGEGTSHPTRQRGRTSLDALRELSPPPMPWSIGPGDALGAPMAILPDLGTLFTMDSRGRLMVADFDARRRSHAIGRTPPL